jgi:hypothetical protein
MSSISPFLLSLTTADVFVWQFQVIVTRAENAITFSHYDYSESAEDPAVVEERKKAEERKKFWNRSSAKVSSSDAESPPSHSSSGKPGGTAHMVEPHSTPQTVPKVMKRPAADASGIVTRQQERRRKLDMV